MKNQFSPLGEKVYELMQKVFGPPYNHRQMRTADYSNSYCVTVNWQHDLGTYDGDHLTRLVFAAHDAALRVEISPCTFRYVKLMFHERDHNGVKSYQRHPTLEQAVDNWRKENPL